MVARLVQGQLAVADVAVASSRYKTKVGCFGRLIPTVAVKL